MHRWIPLLLLSFLLPVRPLFAADETSPKPWEYVRDEQTEITFEFEPDRISFDLRGYGSAEDGQIFSQFGGLKKFGPATYRDQAEEDAPQKWIIEVSGKPGEERLEITASGLQNEHGKEFDFSGTYRLQSAEQRLQKARDRYEHADLALNSAYQKLRTELSKAEALNLREQQRAWLKDRELRAETSIGQHSNPTAHPGYWDFLLNETVEQIEFFHVYTGASVPAGLSGTYRDFHGGELKLEQSKNDLIFSIEVVRGPASHVGQLDGTAKLKSSKVFTFKEVLNPEDLKSGFHPAELTLSRVTEKRIRIEAKNTDRYHGARAYFDGLYLKTGPLEKSIPRVP